MIFSKACEYAVQAVFFLAVRHNGDGPVHLGAISKSLRIPHYFLSKILQTLSKDRILRSSRGMNGGFVLGRPPSEITLLDVVVAVDGMGFLDNCILGFPQCNEQAACPMHNDWAAAKTQILSMMGNKTFSQLVTEWNGKLEDLAVFSK